MSVLRKSDSPTRRSRFVSIAESATKYKEIPRSSTTCATPTPRRQVAHLPGRHALVESSSGSRVILDSAAYLQYILLIRRAHFHSACRTLSVRDDRRMPRAGVLTGHVSALGSSCRPRTTQRRGDSSSSRRPHRICPTYDPQLPPNLTARPEAETGEYRGTKRGWPS